MADDPDQGAAARERRAGPWRTAARRRIGRQLLDGPVGEYQIARAAGLDPSNMRRTLQSLVADQAVEVEADGKPRIWALAPGQAAALEAALLTDQPVGQLCAGQRILRVAVSESQEAAFAAALRTRASTSPVVWVTRVAGAEAQYLLVLDGAAAAVEITSLVQRLSAAGLDVGRLLVEEVLTPDAFNRGLAAVRAVVAEEAR